MANLLSERSEYLNIRQKKKHLNETVAHLL